MAQALRNREQTCQPRVENNPSVEGLRGLVIIPAFNEQQSLGSLLQEIATQAPSFDVVVIDDGSTDETAKLAREAGVTVLQHPFNLGYGVALQTGYKYAKLHRYELLVQIDGDGQHDPRWLTKLCQPIIEDKADVTIGSRFLVGHGYMPPFFRRLGMVIFSFLATSLTRTRVTDPTSGFQALSRQAFEYFAEDHFPFDYPDADVLILLHKARFRFCEVAVTMRLSQTGQSMHSGLSPIYYVFKMLLSIMMTVLRDAPLSATTAQRRGRHDRPASNSANKGS